jgi:hypothetical protein
VNDRRAGRRIREQRKCGENHDNPPSRAWTIIAAFGEAANAAVLTFTVS